MEDMEINLSLDQHGRTRCDDSHKLNYTSKSISTSLHSLPVTDLDDLLYDAEIADCGLMPRTFWMPADSSSCTCWMEQLAQQVFQHHTKGLSNFDVATSGAEWWVQIRPSPPNMGRYALLCDDETSKNSVCFHWDKDEDLRILAGGNLYVHPHISTVTYLTNLGAPTIVMEDHRINAVTGEWLIPDTKVATLSWPRTGKHMSFDGRFLHAAPVEWMDHAAWQQQINAATLEDKVGSRRHRRVTFLVNIWLNYKPFNLERFPMSEKMTKSKPQFQLFHGGEYSDDLIKEVDMSTGESASTLEWSMGACDSHESISMTMDKTRVQCHDDIDTFRLNWKDVGGVIMAKREHDESDGDTKVDEKIRIKKAAATIP